MRALVVWCGLMAVLSIVVVVEYYLPGGPQLPSAIVIAFFIVNVVTYLALSVWARILLQSRGQEWGRGLWRAIPRAFKIVIPVVLAAAVVNFLITFKLETNPSTAHTQGAAFAMFVVLSLAALALSFGLSATLERVTR